MYMAVFVRLFCVPGPRGDKEGDLSYRYLHALHRNGIDVRAISLGGIDLASLSSKRGPAIVDEWAHWERLAPCFATAVPAGYINVVRCAPGQQYGVTCTKKQAAPGMSDSDEVVTTAGLALVELFTSNVQNIAVTNFTPDPSVEEVLALRKYNLVVCAEQRDVDLFWVAGVKAVCHPPNELVSVLNEWTEALSA